MSRVDDPSEEEQPLRLACVRWVDHQPEAAIVLSAAGTILKANDRAASLLGLDPAGGDRALAARVAPAELSAFQSAWSKLTAAAGGTVELRLRAPPDAPRGLRLSLAALGVEGQAPVFLGTVAPAPSTSGLDSDQDVSLKELLTLHALAECCPDSIIRYDNQVRISFLNGRLQSYLGLTSAAEVLGKHPREVWPDGRYAPIVAAVEQALGGIDSVVEFVEPTPNGDAVHHQVRVIGERDASGQAVGAWAFGGKVTELRRAEEAATKSAAMFRSLAENSPDFIVRYDRAGKVVYFNPIFPKTIAIAGQGGAAILEKTMSRVLSTGERETIEVQLPTPDGGVASHEIVLVAERGGGGEVTGALCLGRDVTQRRRLERELRDVLRGARAVVGHAEVVAMMGWDPKHAELTSQQLDWRRTFEDEQAAQAVLPLFLNPGDCYAEAWALAIHPDDRRPLMQAASRALASGTANYRVEFRAVDRDRQVHWFEQVASVEVVAERRWRVTSIYTDITKGRALEEHLRQSQKLEALGLLAGGVAHDFNNILGAIQLQAEVIGLEEHLSTEAREVLEEMHGSANRAAKLVRQLLAFGRKQPMRDQDLDLNLVIGDFAKMLRRYIREDVSLELELWPVPLGVRGDAGMLEQVLMNLATNASDAMPAGGRLRIHTAPKIITAAEAELVPNLAPGTYVCLEVSDTGSGISPEHLPRIFDPFFTTKEVGKGTGLGLATVFGIVKQHQGSIAVRSSNEGTTFEILLLQVSAVRQSSRSADRGRALDRGSGGVLLVEDDAAVRLASARLLARSGYRVLEASDGLAALEVWRTRRDEIDLLLTDLVMPGGVGGRELAARLKRERPDLKVIFTSGYTAEGAGPEPGRLDQEVFLPKPCPPAALLEAIRRVLGSDPRA